MSTLKIELSEAEIRKAIAEFVNSQYNWVEPHIYDEDVEFHIGQQYDHYDRPSGQVLQKAVITVKQG
jgi:hypothetical protein